MKFNKADYVVSGKKTAIKNRPAKGNCPVRQGY